jgi:hypothetical protein
MAVNQVSQGAQTQRQWAINYSQSDIDALREQIVQAESAKRRWLILGLVIAVGGLAGALALLTTNYALYARSETEKENLARENVAVKARADRAQEALDARNARDAKEASDKTDAQEKFQKLLPKILGSTASSQEISAFARMVHQLPDRRAEVTSKPPDKLFHNWRAKTDSGTEIFSLVGGFLEGKWVIYSNLVGRESGDL